MNEIIPINFLVMANTMKFNRKDDLLKVYDLKGSLVGRLVKKGNATMKD